MAGVETLSRRQQREKRQVDADMGELIASPAARRFFVRVFTATGLFNGNPTLDGRAEGRREIGLWLMREIMARRPSAFAELQMENIARDREINDDGRGTDDDE